MSDSVTAHATAGHAQVGDASSPAHAVTDPRFVALVREHYDFVWRVLRRFGLSNVDADDATQQVFIVLSHRVDDVPESKERAFLFKTAMFVAAKAHRARRRRPEAPAVDAGDGADPRPSLDELVDQRRARELLDRVLSEMPHDLKAVLVLFELEGMTMSEIAEALEVPPGTVASRLRRARAELEQRVARARMERPAGARIP